MRIGDAESGCPRSGWQLGVGFATGRYDTVGDETIFYSRHLTSSLGFNTFSLRNLFFELLLSWANFFGSYLSCASSMFLELRFFLLFVCSFIRLFFLSVSLSLSLCLFFFFDSLLRILSLPLAHCLSPSLSLPHFNARAARSVSAPLSPPLSLSLAPSPSPVRNETLLWK